MKADQPNIDNVARLVERVSEEGASAEVLMEELDRDPSLDPAISVLALLVAPRVHNAQPFKRLIRRFDPSEGSEHELDRDQPIVTEANRFFHDLEASVEDEEDENPYELDFGEWEDS